jgi:hypothetical protein
MGAPAKIHHAGPVYHRDVEQGSIQWLELVGVLSASEMKLIITPTLKVAEQR